MGSDAEMDREFWLTQARALSRRINLGWWLETLAVPTLAGSVAIAAALLFLRRTYPHWHLSWLAAACGGAFLLVALVCWLVARRKFEKPEESLVRLEAGMGMNNALTAARAGVAGWPEPTTQVHHGLNWRWQRLVVPPLGALALLTAGLFIPLPASLATTSPPEEPQSWKQLDADLDRLAEEKVVDEKYLEEMKKKLDELKSQEEEQWFSHSSLEATDSLKKNHQAESERMEQELEKAQKALESLEKAGGSTAANEEKKKLLDEFQQSLQGLQNGAMKPNPELLEQMKQLNPEKFGQLTPEQMQQLKENLQKHAQAMKEGKGKSPGEGGEGDDWSDELLSGEGKGKGKGKGQGDSDGKGEGPGKGGISRGPGHDPDVLGDEKDSQEIGELTAMEAKDLSRATPGDLLELQNGEHDVDQSKSQVSEGGATDATGKGGDRVWRESLDPAEQRAVKRFFE